MREGGRRLEKDEEKELVKNERGKGKESERS